MKRLIAIFLFMLMVVGAEHSVNAGMIIQKVTDGGGGEPGEYTKYQVVTIDYTKVDANLVDYPLYIDMSDMDTTTDVFDTCRSDGGDIRVTKSDGTTFLPREIVSVNKGAKTGEMYVNIDSLSDSVDTVIWVWYNGVDPEPAADSTYGSDNTWNSEYVLVQHMNEDPSGPSPQMIDSTGNNNDGTSVGSMLTGDLVAGKMGNGLEFDGIDDYISIPDSDVLTFGSGSVVSNELTFEAFIKPALISGWEGIICKGNEVYNEGEYQFVLNNTPSGSIAVRFVDDSTSALLSIKTDTGHVTTGNWLHMALSYLGNYAPGGIFTYANGDGVANSDNNSGGSYSGMENTAYDLSIGSRAAGNYFTGVIDEVRMSNIKRSNGWLSTSYENMNAPSTFYSVATEGL